MRDRAVPGLRKAAEFAACLFLSLVCWVDAARVTSDHPAAWALVACASALALRAARIAHEYARDAATARSDASRAAEPGSVGGDK